VYGDNSVAQRASPFAYVHADTLCVSACVRVVRAGFGCGGVRLQVFVGSGVLKSFQGCS